MIYLILLSALAGAVCVLLLQILLLYRNKPEPVPRHVQYVKPVVEPSLLDYFSGGKEPPASPDSACSVSASGSRSESCHFLNAIFLFLFRELRDTPIVRHWLTKKIKVEFEELLQTKTAGRLLEGLSLRDISLGNALPVFKSAKLLQPPVPGPGSGSGSGSGSQEEEAAAGPAAAGVPEELNFELELEYNGGFHLAIDVDLVFGKSAYLFVKMRRVVGRLRLQFTRRPFTHWSFAFMDEPFIDFEVKSQFEGRPMPQLTSIIVNQLKRVIKRKHTLPNYKIRYKPFFPYQVLPTVNAANSDLYMQDSSIIEGRLKVTVVECSRLFILGFYDRAEHIHCTLELSTSVWKEKSRSSIKTVELIKGNSQSVGLTFRQIQGSDGDAVHVSVETVTPNSSAAAADLQKGDRLIAIGGVKVTSSVHVLKLIKQAGDKVLVYYERPVGGHQNQQCSSLQDNFGQLEDTGFGPQFGQQTFDDDSVLDSADGKDLDSEFEELMCPEIKPPPTILKEDFAPTSQSPKRSVATLATKPLGSISPILNRKLNLGNYQIPLKSQQKDTVKSAQPKCSDIPDALQPPSKPTLGSTNKPPVPPRPQIKLTLAPSETQYQLESGDVATEKLDKPPPSTNSTEKTMEKNVGKNIDPNEDPAQSKSAASKQDSKEKVPEVTCNVREGTEDNQIWESPEILYRKRFGKWNKATCVFEVENHHKYVNVAIWCKEPFKPGGLICLGHASIKLEEIAMECLSTASLEYQATFRLSAPEPKAVVSRTALRNLSTHKGFNEKLCYGDITLNFTYLKEGDSENSSVQVEKEKEKEDTSPEDIPALSKEDLHTLCTDNKHNFQDTQFQNPTWCDYCKKKVWTKAASQCMICAYVCHKKCQDKCLAAETPFSVAAERRVDLEAKSSFNRSTGLTRHIINTSSRLLNLRPGPRARLADPGVDLVEPSPKHTPNTSDNESSDTETYSASSPSKRLASSTGTKLPVKKEGGLDDSVFIAVKEIGRDLYRGLPTDERYQKLELMLDKLQNEIDQELEHNYALIKEEKESADPRKKLLLSAALSKSGERLQALTLLTIHYKAGYEDLELSESASSSEQQARKVTKISDDILSITTDDIDIASQTDVQPFTDVSNEQTVDDAESLS
ncbi:PDZ domain-containing protein 8 [Carcharodon carcharias]|uniref:PDZ domain-containing protein 8 n=1 Tax=Carcharodon carcharias TaxID=13397 RepID=UPI001B7F0F7F|nr:PDZ domain-containing protein 8 [Carcharodon carcharias]